MSLTFGKPDPNILRSPGGPDFSKFAFHSIGKEPELLKRISSRQEGVHYQYSPSPEPESPPPRYGAEARTRPSLLQALTDHSPSLEPSQTFSMSFESIRREQPVAHASTEEPPNFDSPDVDHDSMQLQYPETPVVAEVPPTTPAPNVTGSPSPSPPPPPPPPPFVPDYPALKELHARLETSQKVLAEPPPPRKAQSPPPDFPRPSLIAANNAVHHTEKTYESAKEALDASRARASTCEQSVTAAQAIVDTLAQTLLAARAALEVAQKSLSEARQAAEEAQAALTASRAAADAAEETKRLVEEPPPPRPPTPEPVNPNAEIINEMKKDLDTLRVWVEEQEAGHLSATCRDTSREREEEERETSSMMIAPDDNDTDGEVRDAKDASPGVPAFENPAQGDEIKMEIDEPLRVSEEDAAEALVALADQKVTAQGEEQQRSGKTGPFTASTEAERFHAEELPENEALAREAALRKLQDVRREQVRIQKEQAQAAAAISILKERQDAAKGKTFAAQSSPPLSQADTQSGNANARAVVLPPSTAAEAKVKAKKAKPVSGGVTLGPDIAVKPDPSLPSDPSPALERAAALGLRVRPTPAKSGESQSAPNSQSGPSKKMRNYSLPPVTHISRETSPSDEISAYRTGSDKGNIHIIPPAKAPKIPFDLSTDIQLLNCRFALEQEGIPWEVISRSRPKLSVKTEESEDVLRSVTIAEASQLKNTPLIWTPQHPPPINPGTLKVPVVAPAVFPTPLLKPLPLPSRKQLAKMKKSATPTNNSQTTKTAAASSAAQPQAIPPPTSTEEDVVGSRPSEVPPVGIPRPWSPLREEPIESMRDVYNNMSIQRQMFPTTQVEAFSRSSDPGSGVTTPVSDVNGSLNYRSLNERVAGREQSPPRYDARSPPHSRTPDWFGTRVSNSYSGGQPEKSRRESPDWYRPPSPDLRQRTPEPFRRRPASPRAYTPPHAQTRRSVSPPSRPSEAAAFPGKRSFTGDHYSPAPRRPSATTSSYVYRHDSPPRGPRQIGSRGPSNPQKRAREDDYTPPTHPQKRFKDDGRDVARAPARGASPPRQWVPREAENERPTLQLRLAGPNVHSVGRGESYRPATTPDHHDRDEQASKPEGLLSRLSDPGRGAVRGRGGARGRPNNRARGGRGRGERSLVDRMD
ncbi:hypothetical protein C8R44DRAFT_81890 [Mycena epipterygia]|nr:hypothetical protein C8R44DRAFT_81890 [Mycena epipterygia]